MSEEPSVGCPACGDSSPLRVEIRTEVAPLHTYTLAEVLNKPWSREWPYAVCDSCGNKWRVEAK